MVEVSDRTSNLLTEAELKQVNRELLFFDEVNSEVAVLKFTLEDVFDRSRWEKLKLPTVYVQQKKRA